MGIFSRKKKAPLTPGSGNFHLAWEEKPLPGPGAGNFAWEVLGLVEFSPIGPTIYAREPMRSTARPMYSYQAVPLQGIPLVSGQIFGQPLYDPATGYSRPLPQPISNLPAYNMPVDIHTPSGNNNPNPFGY